MKNLRHVEHVVWNIVQVLRGHQLAAALPLVEMSRGEDHTARVVLGSFALAPHIVHVAVLVVKQVDGIVRLEEKAAGR